MKRLWFIENALGSNVSTSDYIIALLIIIVLGCILYTKFNKQQIFTFMVNDYTNRFLYCNNRSYEKEMRSL